VPSSNWQQPKPAAAEPAEATTKPAQTSQGEANDWQRPQAAPVPAHTPASIDSPLNRTRAGHAKGTDVAARSTSNHPFAGRPHNPLNRPNARPIANPLNQGRLDPHPAAFPVSQPNPNNPLNHNPAQGPRAMGPAGGAPRLGQPFPFRAVRSDYDDQRPSWAESAPDDDDIDYPSSSSGLWFFVVLLLAGAVAGGYYWYTHGGREILQPPTAKPKPVAQPPRVIRSSPVVPDTQGPSVDTGSAVEQSRGTVFKKRKFRPRRGGSVSTNVRPGTDAIDADTIKKSKSDTKVVQTDDPFEGAEN